MYVVCELRSRFLQNIFLNVIFATTTTKKNKKKTKNKQKKKKNKKKKKQKKNSDIPKSRNLDTDIMNNTQTISKVVPNLHSYFSIVTQYRHHTQNQNAVSIFRAVDKSGFK